MQVVEKQPWMSDKHWKAFFAIINSPLIDITIDEETDEIIETAHRKPLTDEEKASLETLKGKCQSEWDAAEYARNRVVEYPSTGDQMDMIYKDNKNGTTTHADAVEAVKTKWPKDNSGPVE